ncbi:MAG TPA: hypothetical protein VG982_02265 [Candidatus Paceibacterota bacterium]|nr:hypothetical protein [Candidatus Paceibacterota bacterium]
MIKNKIESATFPLRDTDRALRSLTRYAWFTALGVFALYLYFVGAITFSVVKQEGIAQANKDIISQTSKQELSYLSINRTLTEDYAFQNGFVKATTLSYTAPARAFAWNVGN